MRVIPNLLTAVERLSSLREAFVWSFHCMRFITGVMVRYGEIFYELKLSEMSRGISCATNDIYLYEQWP